MTAYNSACRFESFCLLSIVFKLRLRRIDFTLRFKTRIKSFVEATSSTSSIPSISSSIKSSENPSSSSSSHLSNNFFILETIDGSAEIRFWTRTANKFFCPLTFFSLSLIVADSFSFIEFNSLIKEAISLTFSAF